MTMHMANRSVTQPRGIVEDILVKIGKFVFPIDFVSKLTLRVGDEEETFGIKEDFQGSDVQGEVFNIDEKDELRELEKLMEEEIKTIQQVKRTKQRASVPFFVEVIAFTTPTSWVSKESDDLSSNEDEDEVTSKDMTSADEEKKITLELKKNEESLENKGTKRKLDANEIKAKKENSKKAYKRQVQAYKRRWKEQRVQLAMDSSDNST
ncbi:uncharacterized protein LOC111915627 [Lactuca sativa]|uniref:uncharacterized protein LOC111915627 n=1 Tax=Lactuca sativa TaxID=4236 RepID=UPI000CD953D0|nr:uncharacterized protein LOC111915627 [Lactuca sativa]